MEERSRRKVQIGRVISNKMDKTVVIEVERHISHPRYKKTLRKTSKFKAHDEGGSCQVGDLVEIIETRPLSKTKRWRVLNRKGGTPDGSGIKVEDQSVGMGEANDTDL
jgi:small subunit ribosomal protein S17